MSKVTISSAIEAFEALVLHAQGARHALKYNEHISTVEDYVKDIEADVEVQRSYVSQRKLQAEIERRRARLRENLRDLPAALVTIGAAPSDLIGE
jgi:hypothetical protein